MHLLRRRRGADAAELNQGADFADLKEELKLVSDRLSES